MGQTVWECCYKNVKLFTSWILKLLMLECWNKFHQNRCYKVRSKKTKEEKVYEVLDVQIQGDKYTNLYSWSYRRWIYKQRLSRVLKDIASVDYGLLQV